MPGLLRSTHSATRKKAARTIGQASAARTPALYLFDRPVEVNRAGELKSLVSCVARTPFPSLLYWNMRVSKIALAVLFSLLASPAWATTYYLATAAGGGDDSNDGLSISTPWLTPNHAVNCGDLILAAAGNYSPANLTYGKWGKVACPAGNNVAWLKCVTFDACKVSAGASGFDGISVTASYWGVQGWEATATTETSACFKAYPPSATVEIHHIIFANDVANGCYNSGFTFGPSQDVGVDYFVVVGTISYNASQSSLECVSGIDIYQPVQSDSLPGTHIYIAGNFSWANVDPNPCAGVAPTDGNGIILDTLDGKYSLPSPYTAQVLVDNNFLIANGGRGLQVYNNALGATHAAIYIRHNTLWGNNFDSSTSNNYCGETMINVSLNVQEFLNLAATNATDGCGAKDPMYAFYVANGNSTDLVYNNVGWAANGTYGGETSSPGFSYAANNLFGTNPNFVNATAPGAPSCSGTTSVPNCMATVIANFTPTTSAAKSYGYQVPSTTPSYDPLFPQWLCNVNLPAGLVTMGCPAGSAPAPPADLTLVVH
jgi:hypothetical protein